MNSVYAPVTTKAAAIISAKSKKMGSWAPMTAEMPRSKADGNEEEDAHPERAALCERE